jgi:hypothetical protein
MILKRPPNRVAQVICTWSLAHSLQCRTEQPTEQASARTMSAVRRRSPATHQALETYSYCLRTAVMSDAAPACSVGRSVQIKPLCSVVAVGTALRRFRLRPPPAQIPASGTTALGSHLGSWRRIVRPAKDVGFSRAVTTGPRVVSSASSSAGAAGFAVAGSSPTSG